MPSVYTRKHFDDIYRAELYNAVNVHIACSKLKCKQSTINLLQ